MQRLAATATGVHKCVHGQDAYNLCLVMGQYAGIDC